MYMIRTLGSYIEERMEILGLNQTELALRCDVPRVTINRLVKGKTNLPDAGTRRKLAHGMGVTHLDILVAAGEITAEEAGTTTMSLTHAEARLLPVIRSITWTPAMIEGAAKFLTGIREMARELRGIDVAPSELGEVNATEAMREGPGDDVPGGGGSE